MSKPRRVACNWRPRLQWPANHCFGSLGSDCAPDRQAKRRGRGRRRRRAKIDVTYISVHFGRPFEHEIGQRRLLCLPPSSTADRGSGSCAGSARREFVGHESRAQSGLAASRIDAAAAAAAAPSRSPLPIRAIQLGVGLAPLGSVPFASERPSRISE